MICSPTFYTVLTSHGQFWARLRIQDVARQSKSENLQYYLFARGASPAEERDESATAEQRPQHQSTAGRNSFQYCSSEVFKKKNCCRPLPSEGQVDNSCPSRRPRERFQEEEPGARRGPEGLTGGTRHSRGRASLLRWSVLCLHCEFFAMKVSSSLRWWVPPKFSWVRPQPSCWAKEGWIGIHFSWWIFVFCQVFLSGCFVRYFWLVLFSGTFVRYFCPYCDRRTPGQFPCHRGQTD